MTFPTRLQEVLDEGRAVIRSLIKIECGTGTCGFWNGNADLSWSGLTYWPSTLISVSEPVYGVGSAAANFAVELVAKRDFGLEPDKLLLIENEDYKGRPVTVYDAYFDPDDRGALLHVEPMLFGYCDTVDHSTERGEAKLVANIIDGRLDNHRDGYRSASHEDQQLVAPGDKFFEFASRVRSEYFDIKL